MVFFRLAAFAAFRKLRRAAAFCFAVAILASWSTALGRLSQVVIVRPVMLIPRYRQNHASVARCPDPHLRT
jgi:hypothetical protein